MLGREIAKFATTNEELASNMGRVLLPKADDSSMPLRRSHITARDLGWAGTLGDTRPNNSHRIAFCKTLCKRLYLVQFWWFHLYFDNKHNGIFSCFKTLQIGAQYLLSS